MLFILKPKLLAFINLLYFSSYLFFQINLLKSNFQFLKNDF